MAVFFFLLYESYLPCACDIQIVIVITKTANGSEMFTKPEQVKSPSW